MILVLLMMLLMIKSRIETQAAVFDSVEAMGTLIKTQASVIHSIEDYLVREKKNRKYVEKYLRLILKNRENIRNDSEYLWNPVNAYSFLNTMGRDFNFIRNITKDRTGYFKDKTLVFPSRDDLGGASKGLTRVQTTYRLNITLMANGTLVSNFSDYKELYIEHVTPMSSSDCYWLGLEDSDHQGYSGQLLWMKEALKKYYAEECDFCFITEDAIVAMIGKAYVGLREYKSALNWQKRLNTLSPTNHEDNEKLIQELEAKVARGEGHKDKKEQKKAWSQPRDTFLRGCHKDLKPIPSHKLLLLHCYYAVRNTYWTLFPLKLEVLALAPHVVMIHDVNSQAEMEELKNLARPKLESVKVTERKNNTETTISQDKQRVAQGAWFSQDTLAAARLIRRIEYMTELKISPEVRLQAVNYGVGGMFAEHLDYILYSNSSLLDDREAACIYFLSDVEQGGALVFPTLGIKVYPKKGSAVLWMVLYPSGDGNMAMSHSACPVIRGNRWIAVSWPRPRDQTQCELWYHSDGIMTGEKYSKWFRDSKKLHDQSVDIKHWLSIKSTQRLVKNRS